MELKGKVLNILGDSITEGIGLEDIENQRYDNIIKRECGLKAVNNYGVSGTRLAHQYHASQNPRFDLCFCGRVYNMDTSADIVIVYGGANDYIHGDAPIGKKGDKTPATFWGSVYFLMDYLKKNYKGKDIVFITPAHCCYCGGSDTKVSKRSNKREDAMPLLGYVEIIKEMGREFDIPVLDMYNKLGIDPNIPSDSKNYTVDSIHFNHIGHAIIARRIIDFLKEL